MTQPGRLGLENNGKSQRGLGTRLWPRLHSPAASTLARGGRGRGCPQLAAAGMLKKKKKKDYFLPSFLAF